MSRRKNNFYQSALMNNVAYQVYLNKIYSIACGRFKWNGLPPTCNPQFLEKTLLSRGQALFFEDEVIGSLALPFTSQGTLNVYNEPTQRMAYASNGYRAWRNMKDSVIIWNDFQHMPDIMLIRYYAARLWELDRTMDINAKAQKTPVLLQCDESQRLSILNLYKEYDGNSPVIFGDSSLNKESLSFISTAAPYVADKLNELKNNIWNECLTFLGISNVNFSKRANLVTDEVNRSMGGTVASRFGPLEERQNACEAINTMFGLDISCEFRDIDSSEAFSNPISATSKGEEHYE